MSTEWQKRTGKQRSRELAAHGGTRTRRWISRQLHQTMSDANVPADTKHYQMKAAARWTDSQQKTGKAQLKAIDKKEKLKSHVKKKGLRLKKY